MGNNLLRWNFLPEIDFLKPTLGSSGMVLANNSNTDH